MVDARARALRRCSLLAGAWLLACTMPSRARAEGLPVALHWTRGLGAETCIGPTELAQRVEARLGRPVFDPAGTAEVALEGHVQPNSEGGFRVLLSVSDRDGKPIGEREISSPVPDCRSLDDAVTLVIAVTIYPEQGLAGAGIALPDDVARLLGQALDQLARTATPPPAATTKSAPPRPPPPPKRGNAEDFEAAEKDGWHLAVRGVGLGTIGLTPDPVLGAGVAIGVQPPGWPMLEAWAEISFEDQSRFAVDGTRGDVFVNSSRYGGGVCTTQRAQRTFETRGCAGLVALLTEGRTVGLLRDATATVVAAAAFISVRGTLWLGGGFGLEAGANAGLPFVRTRLDIQTQAGRERPVYENAILHAELSLGISWLSGVD